MDRSLVLAVGLFASVLISACGGGGGGGGGGDDAGARSISGTVSGAAGATVHLGGAASKDTTIAADGSYRFSGLADGSYTVQPSLANHSFTPAQRAVALAGADQTGVNFTAADAVAHSISGTVSGAAGATVYLNGVANKNTTVAADGSYQFADLADGNYTVRPVLANHSFTPTETAVTLSGSGQAGVDFAADRRSIGGNVTRGPYAVPGVTITLSGAASRTTTTAANGTYTFDDLADGTYTVTASSTCYNLSAAQTVTLFGVTQPANFQASKAWTTGTLPSSTEWWKSVTYGNGRFVAISNQNSSYNATAAAAYSTDGVHWTSATLPTQALWVSVAYGNGTFVALAQLDKTKSATQEGAYSTDGITWTTMTLPAKSSWMSAAYGVNTATGTGVWVAVGQSAAYSSDGIHWTSATLPAGVNLSAVTYGVDTATGKGTFAGVGHYGAAAHSTDGVNWTAATTSSANDSYGSVAYGGGTFAAVASSTSGSVTQAAVHSTDGAAWTAASMPATTHWGPVTYVGSGFVANVSDYSNEAAFSADGASWVLIPMAKNALWVSGAVGNDTFVALGRFDEGSAALPAACLP